MKPSFIRQTTSALSREEVRSRSLQRLFACTVLLLGILAPLEEEWQLQGRVAQTALLLTVLIYGLVSLGVHLAAGHRGVFLSRLVRGLSVCDWFVLWTCLIAGAPRLNLASVLLVMLCLLRGVRAGSFALWALSGICALGLVALWAFHPGWEGSASLVLGNVALLLLLPLQFNKTTRRLEQDNQYLRMESLTDSLTKALNRRAMEMSLNQALRSGDTFVLGFVDLDDFKQVNDRLGHAVGDELLGRIARAMNQAMRAEDVLYRIAGDEFVIFSPGPATQAGIAAFGVRIRNAVEAQATQLCPQCKVTASVGLLLVDQQPNHHLDSAKQISDLLAEADALMYSAKSQGKNRVVVGVYSSKPVGSNSRIAGVGMSNDGGFR